MDLLNKYKPTDINNFIGNKNSIKLLSEWFKELEKGIPSKRAVLISGKSGIGKSLLAEIMYNEYNYKIYEFNSSDVRSCKSLKESLDKVMESIDVQMICQNYKNKSPGIIMDEIDGMGVGDRGGIQELIKIINPLRGRRSIKKVEKKNLLNKKIVPIICINNDIYDKKINELKKDCLEIKLDKISLNELFEYFKKIITNENINITDESLKKIIIKCNSDIRRIFIIINDIKNTYNNDNITNNNVDEVLNIYEKENIDISLHESSDLVINKNLSESKITEIYESDRCLLPQMIHENYMSSIISRNGDDDKKLESSIEISRVLYLCDYIDKYIYTNQNWDLQNLQCYYSGIIPNYYFNYSGKPKYYTKINFSLCLGKTSLQYTNYKNIEFLIHILNNKNYKFEDLNLIYKKIMLYFNSKNENDIINAKKICDYYDIKYTDLEKLVKVNKIDCDVLLNKTRILFK